MANRFFIHPPAFDPADIHLDVRSDGVITNRSTLSLQNVGRDGTPMFQVASTAGGNGAHTTGVWTFPAAHASWYHGFRFRINGTGNPANAAGSKLFLLYSGAAIQVYAALMQSGAIEIRNGDETVLGTTAAGTVSANRLAYLEFGFTIGASAAWEVKKGGVTVASGTGQTKKTGEADTADGISFFRGAYDGGHGHCCYQDAYLNDGSGTYNNAFMGDMRLDGYLATADSATHDDFTPDTGTDDAARIGTATPTMDDTGYTASSTVGHQQAFTTDALGTTLGTILGMSIDSAMRKTDAGARSMQTIARQSGTTYPVGTTVLEGSYLIYRQSYDRAPDGGALSQALIEALEFGVKIES